ncbi:Aste57867_22461 [Aphanomyces stellatus]|uniref:Aste57867_22461 protein n=1 Tax=Aphanomyces stellatus TaxID=120398 RepID=A0A485LL06_9STRA|nr:hypothetical protein As57867_022391 [Aphanomyces stellatus]VFT99121.1 Aste57867_22461 [Aphanomyces stellatus]
MASNNTLQLHERLSTLHSNSSDKQEEVIDDTYKRIDDLESGDNDGALVEGGALDLFSREALGFFMQYAAIGVIYGMIPALKYPVFNVYLNLEGYQTASYGVLVWLGWSFKVVFGMISDCFPIFGYRRKSWMLVGWSITLVCLAIMSFKSFGEPFCNREKTDYCDKPLEKVPKEELQYFNFDAPNNGTLFILLSMFVSFGYVLSDCAADAMLVQYAQREPVAIRGRTQTSIYIVRTITGIFSYLVTAFGLNGPNYNGSFTFSMSPNVPYMVCLATSVLVCISTILFVVEKKTEGAGFHKWVTTFWSLLQERVMWQVASFKFISTCFQGIDTTAGNPMATYWAKVETLNDSLSNVFGNIIYATILAVVARWGLNWNWRWTIALGTVGVVVIDSFVNFLTIWDVVRNQWFYTGVALANNIPDGVRFIVATFCAVEIAEPGTEGATYGLISTVTNLSSPFASMLYKYIDSFFKVSQNDIKSDTNEVRWDVTYVYLISYACKLSSLAWLWMLPPQKKEIQELKARGGKSKVAGVIFVTFLVLCITFSVSTSIMSIYPSTKCYRIAGGDGILDPKTGKCPSK